MYQRAAAYASWGIFRYLTCYSVLHPTPAIRHRRHHCSPVYQLLNVYCDRPATVVVQKDSCWHSSAIGKDCTADHCNALPICTADHRTASPICTANHGGFL